ncbi:MAG TPA: hypothetical protein VFZ25_17415 [Chloroflexota bacterium]|nr:hypothetical protein [Chloroflexota bacterium]
MTKDELTVAKINAALKILEWSKDDIEPGISGTPSQLYIALAEAFRSVYQIVSDSIGEPAHGDGVSEEAGKVPQGAIA